ncbi:MAG: carotenoid biosynthesis protein [Acidobacteriaceae bacterium]
MPERSGLRNVLIALLIVYAGARVLRIFPTQVPTLLIVVLHVLPPAIFAFIHGRRLYGTRGILIFMGLCLGVGSFFESVSLRTGFPFGHYFFTGVMGPKILQLPILLGLAYVGVGYLAWVVASLIVGAPARSYAGTWLVPCVAAVVMSAWDLAMDQVWANIDHAWVWQQGGGYFGVPFGNYFGWMLTTWVFYQAFALWLRGQKTRAASREWNRLAVLMYGAVAAGNLLLAIPSAIPAGFPATITDAAGRRWLTPDIVGMCIVVSVCVMGPFAVIAWYRTGGTGLGTEERHAPASVHPDQRRGQISVG